MKQDYQQVPLLWTFAVKYDGCCRDILVMEGRVTEELDSNLYSGVVELKTIRIEFLEEYIMKLKINTAIFLSA